MSTGVDDVRVLHVITTLTTGGAERQLELLVARSTAQTATIALYEGGPVADAMQARGQRVEVLGMDGWRRLLAPIRLARLIRRYHPDVVHVHLLAAQLWGIPAARLAGVPVVVSSEHSLMADSIEGRPLTGWLRRLYLGLERLTTHTVAVSRTTAERLERWGVPTQRITVVDNGIDVEALVPDPGERHRVRAEVGATDDDVVIAVVGRLDPVKRVDEVLRAVADRLRGGGHLLVVVGTGSLLDPLQALATELGISDRVRWLGARGDVPAVLSAADVLVSASQDETFGMAVVEGLAAGLPTVYVQAPAVEELDPPVAGAVRARPVRAGEPAVEALHDAIDGVLSARVRRLVPDTRLADRYGAASAAGQVDALYARLTGRAPAISGQTAQVR
jgi:glycosyltransferase involved in cell wall biosynthesis